MRFLSIKPSISVEQFTPIGNTLTVMKLSAFRSIGSSDSSRSISTMSFFYMAIFSLISSSMSFSAMAVPETCIQDPLRTLECPRVKYKMATLKDKGSGEDVRQLVCICLTDFEDLLVEPDNEVAKSMKRRELRSWTRAFGITEEELKELVKY